MGLKTAELLRNLCTTLGHEDAIVVCCKKLVAEHWLEDADDLRNIPRERLESWGVPLKLICEIFEYLEEHDAKSALSGWSSWVNYTLRPALSRSAPAVAINYFKSSVHRHNDPEDWAVRKLQSAWRCRVAKRQVQQDKVLELLDRRDCKLLSPEKAEKVREERAKEKLRRVVRRWRARRATRLAQAGGPNAGSTLPGNRGSKTSHDIKATAQDPVTQLTASLGAVGPNLIFDHCVQVSQGKIKECETSEFVRKIGDELARESPEMAPVIHRLVTINWLEEIDDLELVQDRHWTEWQIPERVVLKIKSKLLERTEGQVSEWIGRACNPFAALWGGSSSASSNDQSRAAGGRRNVEVEDAERRPAPAGPSAAAAKRAAQAKAAFGAPKSRR
mmetsp:Transcript_37523/g.79589  ORF Transcript_37523/g.79589 Transcript_37523/m.79589 type:complete len:389 (+) Transcript_37523:146-1312(+)|eukprot:CAMPEP_0206515574 /NCGR_PEP_ID=MMETSP0324_2-20121206/62878_1 /ASSEMBLY_ACC=CAM_ASM_000836 /TAXON_ID=2866 /ORGANISM="Crypthecodinium cohnii, Strain Seligo" /LENGTH=388 /DNA_ID=CAMNT_0054008393 /DNA_START=227 /DNA_END=1393 /DNA_ORIENTATION=+